MRILFLHDNFPAQFGPLAEYLAARGWDVWFGTQRGRAVKGMNVFNYTPHREATKGVHQYAATFEKAVINGQAAARSFHQLKKSKGLSPDIIMAHSGWGPGMFAKDVWPDAKYVGYFEWFYQPNGPDVVFLNQKEQDADDQLRARGRNAPILIDLAACDVGICPTRWQKSQFPAIFDRHLTVMHDGIDTASCAPAPGKKLSLPGLDLAAGDEVVTYVARGMEPYRGFPQFMAAASEIQKMRPNAHIVVVGEDRVAYGKKLPEGESFLKKALADNEFDQSRLHITGRLSRAQFIEVLQISSVHIYLTAPFVLSWSMMEAMSAGCLILGSDTEPVRELVEHGANGLLADFYDVEGIAKRAAEILASPAEFAPLRAAARQTILDRYAMTDILPRKESLLTSL